MNQTESALIWKRILCVTINLLFVLTSPLWVLPCLFGYFVFHADAESQRHGDALFF